MDDVANLLHIPIEGTMLEFEMKMNREHGMRMMTRLLGMLDVAAAKACKDEYGAHITYPALKWLYEEHLTAARQLEVSQLMEKLLERDRGRQWCIRSFILYLVGSTLFANKTNIHINMIYLECMVDLNTVGRWSWGGMTLAYLYY